MRLRPPTIDDAPAVLGALVAREIADIGVADDALEDLLDEWRASDLDLAGDACVVEVDGQVVAYAIVHGPTTAVAVTPRSEGRGIGARLLQWTQERERALGRSVHRQRIGSGNARGKALLQAAGYRLVRSHFRMGLALAALREVPRRGPEGVVLRAVDVARDAVALHALDDASFAGAPDYHPQTLQAFREEHLDAYDLDPRLSRVAERDGRIAGFLLARRWPATHVGYVAILAVHPEHQGRGLGSALLAEAFARFRAAGLREAQLGVASTNPRALELYERVGMTPRFRYDTYERPLG